MDPLIVFDAKKAVPDHFALVVAAAARARALQGGAEPRVDVHSEPGPHLALSEVVSGAFAEEELEPFLPDCRAGVPRLGAPKAGLELCNGGQGVAAAPVLLGRTVY